MVSDAFKGVPPPSASLGHWLPEDRAHIKIWLAKKLDQLDRQDSVPLDPSIIAMQDLVAANPYLNRLSQQMFTQIPPTYVKDPTGKPQVRDFNTMLGLVNIILKEGPQWFDITDPPTAMGLIGFPINAILDWPMGTAAGHEFFLNPEANAKWQGILNTWGTFLKSPESLPCLNESSGWLSPDALNLLSAKGNDGKTQYTFAQLYACDPSRPFFGFTSWDNFFTREFNDGIRPTEYKHSKDVIVNACESTPLQIVTNVQLNSQFWLKEQPYSLADMLDNDPFTREFVGGSVYQAFLSALSYHCWRAPVSGTVHGIRHVAGTYYAENFFEGFDNPDGPDPNAPNNSQPYISAVATRGIIFIKADDPIGLMAIVFVGMAEVSSCEFTVRVGDSVEERRPDWKVPLWRLHPLHGV